MRTYKHLLLFALPPMVLAGCAQDIDGPADDPNGLGGEITFNIGFAGPYAGDAQTRVVTGTDFKSAWETGDEIGVFATMSGQPPAASGNYINNVRLTYRSAGGGTWGLDDSVELYWPSGGGRLDFYAYHPWVAVFDPVNGVFTVQTDQRDTGYSVSDLMVAVSDNGGASYDATTTAVPLTFYHALAMIQVTLDNSTGLLDTNNDITVTLRGVAPDLATGTLVSGGEKTDITMHRLDTGDPADLLFRALVPAQTLAGGTRLFHITDGTRILVSPPLDADIALQEGRAETFGQRIPMPENYATIIACYFLKYDEQRRRRSNRRASSDNCRPCRRCRRSSR